MRYPNLDVAERVQYMITPAPGSDAEVVSKAQRGSPYRVVPGSVCIGPIRRATAKNFEHEPLSETKTKAMSYFGAKLTLQICPLVTDAAAQADDQPPTTAARTKRSIAPD
jgi:hypothetical protein